MGTTKLTLSADADLVKKAKAYAAENGTSLSALVSRLLRSVVREREGAPRTGSLTRRATGMIHLPAGADDSELIADALADRHAE